MTDPAAQYGVSIMESTCESEIDDTPSEIPVKSQVFWPYKLLERRRPPRKSVFHGVTWHDRHHIVASKCNSILPPGTRGYFDSIPYIRRAKNDEFDCLVTQQPEVHDTEEQLAQVRRKFDTFPFFRPHTAEVRSKARDKIAASPAQPSRSRTPALEDLVPCDTLMAAVKFRQQAEQRRLAARAKQMMAQGMGHLQHERTAVDFVKWVVEFHGNLVRVWRKLDKSGDMNLTRNEFFIGLKRLRHQNELKKIDLNQLWQLLDRDGTGLISFFEFAPEIAMDLARLKQWGIDEFGSMRGLFNAMDVDGSGKVSLHEFKEEGKRLGLPERLHKSAATLFQMLDDGEDEHDRGLLTMDELAFLDEWKAPLFLRERADKPAAHAFRRALIERHCWNPLTAWRRCLDTDGSMVVGYDEFVTACRSLHRQGLKEADPSCGVTQMYCGLDNNRSGRFTLYDWDPITHRCLSAFVLGARAEYDRVVEFVRKHEESKNSGMTRYDFRRACKAELKMTNHDADLVFCGLAHHDGTSPLMATDVIFLQKWEPEEEIKEEQRWLQMAQHRGTVAGLEAQHLEAFAEKHNSHPRVLKQ